jgi:hypothetical protein
MADLTFYSSIRRGAALAITRQDSPTPSNPAIVRVTLPVTLSYAAETTTAGTSLSLLGPGEIVGLDTRSVIRMFPPPNDNDAEAGFLCHLEFDQVDLPWRYTPAANAGSISSHTDRIRPWLTLVVLAEGTDFASADLRPAQGNEKLPQLTVGSLNLLPDLSQVWAWAHVQGQQTLDDAGIATALAGPPGQLVARLLSPRQLAPSTAYTAFLLPTFERGMLAAQGIDPKTIDGLAPAWDEHTTFPLTLPVYHSWRFQTGTVSSFRQAASELRPVATLPSTVGVRAMDVSSPGFSLKSPTGGTDPLFLGGALQTPEQAALPDPTLSTDWLNGIGALVDLGTLPVGGKSVPVVTPPIYGRWYAAEDHLDYPTRPTPTNPPWFSLLNQDPRFRVAAGLGTEVVQRDQQALMAAAQEQASVLINTVNRRRKIMQTGREVFTRLVVRHLNTGSLALESIFLVTAFLHGKILSCAGGGPPTPTIAGIVAGSPFGGLVLPWRRPFHGPTKHLIDTINGGGFIPQPANPPNMATPGTTVGGAIPGGLPDPGVTTIVNTMTSDQLLYWGVVIFWVARKLLSTQGGKYWWLLRRLLRLGLDLIQLAGTQGVSAVTVLEKLRAGTLLGPDIQALPPASIFASIAQEPVLSDPTTWTPPRVPSTGPDNAQAAAFRQAAIDLFNFINGTPLPGPSIPALKLPSLVTCILNALSPAITFVAAEQARHVQTRTIAWQAADQLEPILLPPAVLYPMWHRLANISVDWIVPNVGDVPRNSVCLLETNQKFIEAFMVGLNHQVNRELLWTGYPTDQRGTMFQQFWDPSGWVDGQGTGARTDAAFFDITEVRSWNGTSTLGTHTGRTPNVEHLVLLVRGDVIKRYPNVVVYAAKAAVDPQSGAVHIDDTNQKYPVFQAVLTGDVAYYGFELTAEQALGSGSDHGWYFILQEHPSEPKFNDPTQTPSGVNALPIDYKSDNNNQDVKVSADLASIAFETPTRVAILGKDLLPAQG